MLLKGIYDLSAGDTADWVDVSKVSHRLGMTDPSARAGANYVAGRGLVQDRRVMGDLPTVNLTVSGVDATEGALAQPNRPTRDFPAAINVLHVGTTIGGSIMQGSAGATQHNTASFTQQGWDMASLARDLGALKGVLRAEARTPDQFRALAEVAAAEESAKKGDGRATAGALGKLGMAGRWVAGLAQALAS